MPPGPTPTAARARAVAFTVTVCGVRAERAVAGALVVLRAVVLFEARGEDPVDDEVLLAFGAEDPVLDESEPPLSDGAAQAIPAPLRIAVPIPRATARPPRRPTYAAAFFVGPITSPLALSTDGTASGKPHGSL
ncbi:hypothetical protein MSZK_38260 [Mycobacterium sp. shizuoka-1]|nr:hypothetical protein MSZK_38260 [Mycobacterium sp. shizuoka-1]